MDYAGEQAMELEALEAIFPDDLEEYDGTLPDGWAARSAGKVWAFALRPTADADAGADEDLDSELQMQLLFAHTPTYPDEPPCIRLRAVRGLGDADVAEATALLESTAQEGLGMAVIYNLITAAQEWLTTRAAAGAAGTGGGADEEAEERRRREEEEAARAAARAHGTPVTPEAFAAWREHFEAAAVSARRAGGTADSAKLAATDGTRLTGKQWFMQQIAAGKAESGSEEEEEDDDDDEVDDAVRQADDGDEVEDESEDIDYDDDDDEGLLEEYGNTAA